MHLIFLRQYSLYHPTAALNVSFIGEERFRKCKRCDQPLRYTVIKTVTTDKKTKGHEDSDKTVILESSRQKSIPLCSTGKFTLLMISVDTARMNLHRHK
jgi:hypothetical protein